MALEHSRGLLLGARATGRGESELETALDASRVVLSADPTVPMGITTLKVLLTTMRRGPCVLVLERGQLAGGVVDDLVAAVAAVDPDRPLQVVQSARDEPTVRLHIGADDDRAIRLVPEGFGAHVAGQRSAVIRPSRPGNAIGAVYTAALGAAEAFKVMAQVLPARRVLHRHLRFCPLTLSEDLGAAPQLPAELWLELALLGVGAIGTGVVLLLDLLGAEGCLLAVDRQRFGRENRGTYSLGGEAEALTGPWKVALAQAALPRFQVIPCSRSVEDLPAAVDAGKVPWFPVVISGLDSAESRRAAQRLWPDRLIDAATGDTMLGLHDHVHGAGPCLVCLFPPNYEGPSAAQRLAEATGLSVARAMRGDDPLEEDDLVGLTSDQRERLRPHLGKPVCGLAETFGLTSLEADGYRPSIPFVSLQASCLTVARLVAHHVGFPVAGNLVQYDGLFGPQAATIEWMDPLPECYCQVKTDVINQVRASRTAHRFSDRSG